MDQTSFGLTLPATPASVSVVRYLFGGVQPMWAVSDLLMHDIQIAVSEACTNVVKHAYDTGAPGMLEIAAGLDGDAVVVRVRDNGPGLATTAGAPAMATSELGVGLALIAALATRMEVGHGPDGAHEVAMEFALTDGGPPA
ncbi:MAG: ATP-binding protein [Solirubrobacterales bacterium]|nr:ATP-binding protein [Solirubrobacterales bacterium]